MGDKIKRKVTLNPLDTLKTGFEIGTGTFGESRKIQKATRQLQEKPFRKGATAAKRTAASQIAKQQQTENIRLAEAESDVATGRALAKSKTGRRSLLKSSPGGLAVNLGGSSA